MIEYLRKVGEIMNLTKESKLLLFEMYNQYLLRRSCGKSRRESKRFGSPERIREVLSLDMLPEDLDDSLVELKRNGFIKGLCCNNSVDLCELTDYAIVTLEQLPSDALSTLAKFLAHFIP